MKRLEELVRDIPAQRLMTYVVALNLGLGTFSLMSGNYGIALFQMTLAGYFGYRRRNILQLEHEAKFLLEQSPYSALDIPITASKKQIKAAYRKLAMKYHPDRNKAPDAADRFNKATWAYKRLT